MSTEISNPKSALLLEAGFNVLHFESQEWLDTIAFWKDEFRFFEYLLRKKESAEDNKQNYSNMLKSLDKIYTSLFEDIEDDILDHEKLLSRLLKGEEGIADASYREKHRQFMERMESFKHDFLKFKKIVFQYVKEL